MKSFNFFSRNILSALFVAFAVIAISGCGTAPPSGPPAFPVTAAKAESRDMPVQVESVGTVEAFNSVIIAPQVTGRVLRLHFKEGQEVKTGDLLVTIDPAPFEQKLSQAQSQYNRAVEQGAFIDVTAKRYDDLFRQGAISKQTYEQAVSAAAAQAASIQEARAVAENARIDVENCYVRSPINGRTGAFLANIGAVVKVNDSQLLTINQVEPVFVKFSAQEKDLAAIIVAQSRDPLKVIASIPEQKLLVTNGTLTFIDNSVDKSTGVIQMKAEFANANRELWPGQFVRATVVLGIQPNAVVIPSEAVTLGQAGRFVYVIKEDMTAELRPVEQDRIIGAVAVISKGVNAGETVVTDGQVNLRNGAKVLIKDPATKQAPQGGAPR